MINKLIKVALIGKTNAGKSTLLNTIVGEEISIINKKINTTQEFITGIKNLDNVQIIFFDTPGSNFLKTNSLLQKKLKTNIWQAIDSSDLLIYLIDVLKYNFKEIEKDILKLSEVSKPILFIFNKIDLIESKKVLFFINELKNNNNIKEFFLISAKKNHGISFFLDYLSSKSFEKDWIYKENEITDKDDIFISNECTRNAILEYLHQEIPYNVKIINNAYKQLNDNELKIKQSILLYNKRYKPIILGKRGINIKRIREKSQSDIKNILNCKVHLYLQVEVINEN